MNYSKKIMATLLVAFGLITNVNATSKWDTTRNDYSTTTDEITVAYDEENYTIIYTIPQNYSGEEIYFNITDDIETILAGSYVPGENAPFKIRVINNSDVDYHYVEDSLTIDTLDLDYEFDELYSQYGEEVWNYYDNGNHGIYIKDAYGFDGNLLVGSYSIRRTGNSAIAFLYTRAEGYRNGEYNNCDVYDEYTDSYLIKGTDRYCAPLLTDENLGQELINQGYVNGIADLHLYYLDYYNNKLDEDPSNDTNYTELEDLPLNTIIGNNFSYGGVLGGKKFNMYETNPYVNALGYNWFYNMGLSVFPLVDASGNQTVAVDCYYGSCYYYDVDNSYTVGAYMRGENTVFEEVFRTDLGLVEANSQNDLREFMMAVNGDNVLNAHQIMNFGYMMSFSLEQEIVYGDLIVHYVDEDGNKLTEDITSSDEVGNPYETKSMEFDGYHLIRVEGHETGEYIDGTIHVTYVYALDGIGDVEDPEEPTTPVEPEEPTDSVEPPHTDVEVNNVSINNIIYYCEDRKKCIK